GTVGCSAFEDERRFRTPSFVLDDLSGPWGPEFLVGGDEEADAVEAAQFGADAGQRVDGDEQSALHIIGTGTAHDSVLDGVGEVFDGPGRPGGGGGAADHAPARTGPEPPEALRVRAGFDDAWGRAEHSGADPRDELSASGQRRGVL